MKDGSDIGKRSKVNPFIILFWILRNDYLLPEAAEKWPQLRTYRINPRNALRRGICNEIEADGRSCFQHQGIAGRGCKKDAEKWLRRMTRPRWGNPKLERAEDDEISL